MQTIQGPNVYEVYGKEHNEGFHHVGVQVEDMDAALKLLQSKGAPPSQCAAWDGTQGKGRAVYLDTDSHGGVTLELIWNQRMAK